MGFRIYITEDEDEFREIEALAFPQDVKVEKGHVFWIARDAKNRAVGFCSARYWEDERCAYLSRVAVALHAQGKGLARKMVLLRLKWAQEMGAQLAYTYTTMRNYASLYNLLRCGFKCYDYGRRNRYYGREWHHLSYHFKGGQRPLTPAQLRVFKRRA